MSGAGLGREVIFEDRTQRERTAATVELAASDHQAAPNTWGLGNLFLGLSMLSVGWAIVSTKGLPVFLGWVGLIAGIASVVNVLGTETPVSVFATANFVPTLLFTTVFRIWAGYELWITEARSLHRPAERGEEPLETWRSNGEQL